MTDYEDYIMPLKTAMRLIRERISKDWDEVSVITGDRGVGKTSFLINASQEYMGGKFDLSKHLMPISNPEKFKQCFQGQRDGFIGMDEAIYGMNRQDWYTQISKEINKMYATKRYYHNVTMFCIPNFWRLNSEMRNDYVRSWFQIYDRGIALLFVKNSDKDMSDPWGQKHAIKLKSEMHFQEKCKDTNAIIKAEVKMPGFTALIPFGKVEDELWKQYKDLRDAAHKEMEEPKPLKEGEDLDILNSKGQIYACRMVELIEHLRAEPYNYSWSEIASLVRVGRVVGGVKTPIGLQQVCSNIRQSKFYIINWVKGDFSQKHTLNGHTGRYEGDKVCEQPTLIESTNTSEPTA